MIGAQELCVSVQTDESRSLTASEADNAWRCCRKLLLLSPPHFWRFRWLIRSGLRLGRKEVDLKGLLPGAFRYMLLLS
jgi:hypothetical protein